MLKIRLQRIGKRGQAYFKVVVTEHTRKPKGKYLELLGSYDPHKNEIAVDGEKIKYWLGHGAKISPTVNNLLVGKGVIEGEKVRAWKPKNRGNTELPAADTETRKSPETESEAQKKTEGTETKPLETKEEAKEKLKEEKKIEEPVAEVPKEESKVEEPAIVQVETQTVQ